jgi:hypothetical protein
MRTLKIKSAWVVLLYIWVFLFACAEGWGADWKLIGTDIHGTALEIDTASISRRHNSIVRAWFKTTHSKEDLNNFVKNPGEKYKDLSHSKTLTEFDCTEKKCVS